MAGRATKLAIFLSAVCWVVAGCGALDAASDGAAPVRHVVCTSTAGICSASIMRSKPREMFLSADGSLYVRRIVWTGWGATSATGRGTASADNCSPNCAQGTYHSYPAVITVSDPRPWHRIIAYARVRASVAAIRYRYAFTRGLIPAAGQTPRPASTPSSPPAISASLLSTSCKLGYANGGTFEPNTAANWDAYPGYSAEMITLTNVGTSGVTLQGFKTQTTWRGQVVAAHQISSAPNLPEFLTPGQTYSTLIEFSSLSGDVTVTENTYLHSQCAVATWYHS